MKLGIGTVQFGMNYGISNQEGKTPLSEVQSIMTFARVNGIDMIDTAHGYGDSESVLGAVLSRGHRFSIITKTPGFPSRPLQPADATALKRAFLDSLAKLRQKNAEGLLVHNADDLLAPGGELLYAALQEIKKEGGVNRVGVSVYAGDQIDALLERYPLDLIQLPINVLDTRLLESSRLAALKQKGVEIHARSIFLQGLLLLDPERIHPYFEPVKPVLRRYHVFLQENGLTPVEGAFCFITGIAEIDYVIIGVNSLTQLHENYEAVNRTYADTVRQQLRAFSLDDARYLNPARWRVHAA